MKIAHIVCSYPPLFSGMGNVVFQTVSELAGRGHGVEVFTPQYDAVHPEPEQVDYARRLPAKISYGNAAYMPQVARELDGFDIVHLHYPFFGVANIVRKWKLRHPDRSLVVTYHMDNRAKGLKGLAFSLYAKFWMSRILDAADLIIGSSFDYVESSDAREHFATHKKKWRELPFGVDTVRFAPRERSEDLFDRHGLDGDIPTLLFVGGMDLPHYFKGVPVLLNAMLLLKKQGVDVQLVLVGDGELKKQFESRAAGYGIADRVRFAGRVSDEELPRYYNMADLVVLPSVTQGEAFGMVLLESMASGVPVLASNLPGVRIVAADGGITCMPRDHRGLAENIVGYLSAKTDHAAWRKKVREAAEQKYAWPHIVDTLEGWYKELV